MNICVIENVTHYIGVSLDELPTRNGATNVGAAAGLLRTRNKLIGKMLDGPKSTRIKKMSTKMTGRRSLASSGLSPKKLEKSLCESRSSPNALSLPEGDIGDTRTSKEDFVSESSIKHDGKRQSLRRRWTDNESESDSQTYNPLSMEEDDDVLQIAFSTSQPQPLMLAASNSQGDLLDLHETFLDESFTSHGCDFYSCLDGQSLHQHLPNMEFFLPRVQFHRIDIDDFYSSLDVKSPYAISGPVFADPVAM